MIYCVRVATEENGSDWYLVIADNEEKAISIATENVNDIISVAIENYEDVLHEQYRGVCKLHCV